MNREVMVVMEKVPSSAWKYILGACALLGIGSGAYLWNRNKKKEINKNDTTNQQCAKDAIQ